MELNIKGKLFVLSWEQKKQLLFSFFYAIYTGMSSYFLIWFRKTQGTIRELELYYLAEDGKKVFSRSWIHITFSLQEQLIFFSLILILGLLPLLCAKILVKKKILPKIDLATIVAILLLTWTIILGIGLVLGVSTGSYFDAGYYPI